MLSQAAIPDFDLLVLWGAWGALALGTLKKEDVVIWNVAMIAVYTAAYAIVRALLPSGSPEMEAALFQANIAVSLLHIPIIAMIVVRARRLEHIVVAACLAVELAYWGVGSHSPVASHLLLRCVKTVSIALILRLQLGAPWRPWLLRAGSVMSSRLRPGSRRLSADPQPGVAIES